MTESRTVFKRRADRYAQISNTALRDRNLRLADKGLLAWVMHLPETWIFRRTHAKEQLGVGRDALDGCIQNLMKHGYCRREQHRDEQGKLTNVVVYYWTDIAGDFGDEETPDSKPFPGNPKTANPPLINKQRYKNTNKNNESSARPEDECREATLRVSSGSGTEVEAPTTPSASRPAAAPRGARRVATLARSAVKTNSMQAVIPIRYRATPEDHAINVALAEGRIR